MRRLPHVAVALAFAVYGCTLLSPLEDHTAPVDGGTAATAADAMGVDAGGDARLGDGESPDAPRLDAAPRDAHADANTRCVRIDAGTKSYCIDVTEVTREQYREFLAAWSRDAAALATPPGCEWNGDPVPGYSWPPPNDGSRDKDPINNIDWCDAYAYCAWVGKRLCGSVADGGAYPNASVKDQAVSEWYRACSAAGTRTYPYGSAYDASTCNGCESQGICSQQAFDRTRPVGSLADCKGGASPELLDMSGNVQEWENSCIGSTGRLDECNARGGGWPNDAIDVRCTSAFKWKRDMVAGEIGVRCCAP